MRVALCLGHPFWFPDAADYDALAKAILHHDAYQVNGLYATRIPGYPVFVALIYLVCGASQTAVLVGQSLLGGMTIWLVYAIAPRGKRLAALLAALDPLSIGFTAALLSETPFTVLLLLALWLLVKIRGGKSLLLWLLLGLVWGLAVYMRASALLLLIPLALWAVWGGKGWKGWGGWAGTGISLLVMMAVLLPWQIRNYGLFHSHFFRLTTLEGISLYEAVYSEADGSPKQDKIALPPDMQTLDEASRNDEWNRRAWEYIRTDPVRMLELAIRKTGRTWSPALNAVEFRNPLIQLALACWYIPLFVLAFVGLLSRQLPTHPKILLLIPILYFTAVHALYLGSVRYRVPLMPLVCILAAAGIMEMLERLRRTKPDGNLEV